MGSIGYAITALILGIIIKITNINSSYVGYFLMTLIGIITLSGIKYKGKSNKSGISLTDVYKIVKNKRFILITISAIIANTAMGANGNYLAVLIQKTGGDVSNLGMLWFIIAMSELPAFFFGAKIIKKHGVLNIYLLGLLIYTARFLIDSFCPSYQFVLLVQILQGVTFPLYLMATLQYVQDIVPNSVRTTAITAFTACSGGIGGFFGNICGGIIIQYMNVFILFRVMSAMCIIAFIIGSLLKLYSNRRTKDEFLEKVC
jgi:MFS family permease